MMLNAESQFLRIQERRNLIPGEINSSQLWEDLKHNAPLQLTFLSIRRDVSSAPDSDSMLIKSCKRDDFAVPLPRVNSPAY